MCHGALLRYTCTPPPPSLPPCGQRAAGVWGQHHTAVFVVPVARYNDCMHLPYQDCLSKRRASVVGGESSHRYGTLSHYHPYRDQPSQ
jgi:hypothetical protein